MAAAPPPCTFVFKKRKKRKRNPNLRAKDATVSSGSPSATKKDLSDEEQEVKKSLAELRNKAREKRGGIASRTTRMKKSEADTVKSDRNVAFRMDLNATVDTTEERKERDRLKVKYAGQNKWVGPRPAPSNIRTFTRFDYHPSLCKDYNETGFCGYGDNCKYLHDRGDYKSGWEMEQEWEQEQERKKRRLQGEVLSEDEDWEIHSDEEDLPHACFICRDDFTDPVVTECGHYFCEACALARFKKKQSCAACGKHIMGSFTAAEKILTVIEKRKARAEARKKKEDKAQADKEAAGKGVNVQQGWAFPAGE